MRVINQLPQAYFWWKNIKNNLKPTPAATNFIKWCKNL